VRTLHHREARRARWRGYPSPYRVRPCLWSISSCARSTHLSAARRLAVICREPFIVRSVDVDDPDQVVYMMITAGEVDLGGHDGGGPLSPRGIPIAATG
jgi:hypothetical protein